MSHETVGSLLAIIANSLNDGLRTLMFADKRAWGFNEFEQLRLLEETLDEAKKDFQELPVLVNGRFYYENDRTTQSLEDLRILCTHFELHSQIFKDWARTGGPIDPAWARQTRGLRRELHQAQCRAAQRIHEAEQAGASGSRCLGALQVYRAQQRRRRDANDDEEAAACRATGVFERLGDRDIAFVCDFCDGYLDWEDLREMPTRRAAPVVTTNTSTTTTSTTSTPNASSDLEHASNATQDDWQAQGAAQTSGEPKTIVFAAVAIANHLPPEPGAWRSRILCPFCDEYYHEEQGDDDMERVRYAQDERGFAHVRAFHEHLDWYHVSMMPAAAARPASCGVM
ncbi:hypothetical protein F4779DRAFT_165131 [Xylariaceae sp. FL0662B]|nr:hypothetical protein F4779DRAFT_165131 [Xylariaceae sp. FL0662B]